MIGVITRVACAGVVLTIGHRFASFMSIGLIALAAVVPQALSAVSGAVLRGSGRIGVGAAAELGSIPVLAIAIIFLEAATSRATLTGAIVALVIAAWLTAAWSIPAALITAHSQPTRSEAHPSLTGFLLKRLPQPTWMMGSSPLFYALTWPPVFMLAVTRGPTDVAFFTTAARLAAVIGLVPAVQVTYLAPAFSRLYHLGEIAGLNRLCNRTTWQAMLAAAVPAGVLVAASHPVVVALYGDAFASAGIPLVVLSVAALIAVAAGQTTQLMLLCDLEATALVLNSGWLLGWITIGVVVVTQKGVVGAAAFALASGGVYAGLAILALVRSRGIYSFVRAPAL